MDSNEITLDITVEELIAAQLVHLDIQPEPSIEDGWLQFNRDIDPHKPDGMATNTIRRHYDNAVKKGLAERKKWGKDMYYRILEKEETQPEDNE